MFQSSGVREQIFLLGRVPNHFSNGLNWVLEYRNLSPLTSDGSNRPSFRDSKRWAKRELTARLHRNICTDGVSQVTLRYSTLLSELNCTVTRTDVGSEACYSFRSLSLQQDATSTPETDSLSASIPQGDTLVRRNYFLNPAVHCSVNVVTGLRTGRQRNRSSTPERTRDFLYTTILPWGLPSLLYDGYQG
jgi:hypothetical protein